MTNQICVQFVFNMADSNSTYKNICLHLFIIIKIQWITCVYYKCSLNFCILLYSFIEAQIIQFWKYSLFIGSLSLQEMIIEVDYGELDQSLLQVYRFCLDSGPGLSAGINIPSTSLATDIAMNGSNSRPRNNVASQLLSSILFSEMENNM